MMKRLQAKRKNPPREKRGPSISLGLVHAAHLNVFPNRTALMFWTQAKTKTLKESGERGINCTAIPASPWYPRHGEEVLKNEAEHQSNICSERNMTQRETWIKCARVCTFGLRCRDEPIYDNSNTNAARVTALYPSQRWALSKPQVTVALIRT